MAVYTQVSRAALTPFLAKFDLPPADLLDGIAQGVENTNYKVTIGDQRYILTLFEKRVAANDLPYFLDLMEHVVVKGVPGAAPQRDQHGKILQELCGRPAALIAFLDGASPVAPNLAQAKNAGTTLAQFHLATEDFPQDRANTLGPQGWVDLITNLGPSLDQITANLFSELSQDMRSMAWPENMPRGTIHADLFPDNVLFQDNAVSGVIDFYFACTDYYAYDLAISMNAWTPEGSLAPNHAQAFLAGYEAARPLSPAEKKALPLFLKGSALRFLLTRAHDFLHQVPDSLVTVKDPKVYLNLYRHHRDTPTGFTGDFS